jgi:cytochrome c
MKRIVISTAIGAAVAVFQSAAWAVDAKLAQDELKEHGCLNCHEMDKKKVGPGYKEVAAKYKEKSVEDVMASMKSKPVHKVPLQKTTDSSLKVMLEWILGK